MSQFPRQFPSPVSDPSGSANLQRPLGGTLELTMLGSASQETPALFVVFFESDKGLFFLWASAQLPLVNVSPTLADFSYREVKPTLAKVQSLTNINSLESLG